MDSWVRVCLACSSAKRRMEVEKARRATKEAIVAVVDGVSLGCDVVSGVGLSYDFGASGSSRQDPKVEIREKRLAGLTDER